MRRHVAVLLAALLAGCVSGSATLEVAGEGGGERTRLVACEGEAGAAHARLSLEARTDEGLVTILVLDGMGERVHERHVGTLSGDVDEEAALRGAPGKWTLEERRTDNYRGTVRATLACEG